MDFAQLLLDALSSPCNHKEDIDAQLKKVDFGLAEKINYKDFARVDKASKILQVLYKLYILGVVRDNKKMRVDCLRKMEALLPELTKNAKQFKDFFNSEKYIKNEIEIEML